MKAIERVLEVLDGSKLIFLGTCDNNKSWVTPLIFVHDEDLNIFWQSNPKVLHSKNIEKNGEASGSVILNDGFVGNGKELAIQLEGIVEILHEDSDVLSRKLFEKKNTNGQIYSGKSELWPGNCWYKLTPNKIYLTDQENFGYERQELILK